MNGTSTISPLITVYSIMAVATGRPGYQLEAGEGFSTDSHYSVRLLCCLPDGSIRVWHLRSYSYFLSCMDKQVGSLCNKALRLLYFIFTEVSSQASKTDPFFRHYIFFSKKKMPLCLVITKKTTLWYFWHPIWSLKTMTKLSPLDYFFTSQWERADLEIFSKWMLHTFTVLARLSPIRLCSPTFFKGWHSWWTSRVWPWDTPIDGNLKKTRNPSLPLIKLLPTTLKNKKVEVTWIVLGALWHSNQIS